MVTTLDYDINITYRLMINAAQNRRFLTCQEIAHATSINTISRKTQRILIQRNVSHLTNIISKNEVNQGRPMLSAIVVDKRNQPSDEFYTLAKELGLFDDGQGKEEFWRAECEKVYQMWQSEYLKWWTPFIA